jgi:glycerol uptake facilitator-like aquaporin
VKPTLLRRVVAEFAGTLLLLAAVVGSGIMGERLAAGNVALALLAKTLADAWMGGIAWRDAPAYLVAQTAGALAGVIAAHMMFGLAVVSVSTHARSGAAQAFSEFVATFGLLAVIWGCARTRPTAVPFAVGAYITAAYWFTASTSFANPAVTVARSLTNTFAGVRPLDVPAFIAAQFAGAFGATLLFRWLLPPVTGKRPSVVVRQDSA